MVHQPGFGGIAPEAGDQSSQTELDPRRGIGDHAQRLPQADMPPFRPEG